MGPYRMVLVSLLMVFVAVAGNDKTTAEKDNNTDTDGDILPNEDGILYNEGQTNPQAYETELVQEEENEQRKEYENTGDHDYELKILDIEAEYEKWWTEYLETGVMPEISDIIQEFLDDLGLTTEDLEKEYEKRKTEGSSSRKKRSYLASNAGRWTKCIIPYVYESLTESDKVGMEKVHAYYERYTGFRFVKFNGTETKDKYGLDHQNYIRYVRASGCWSFVGNLRGKGQKLSPCGGGGVAIHELGHALGMMHEQKNPQSFPYIRVEYDYINPSYRSEYYRNDIDALYDRNGFYDISSRMHYGRWGFNINYGRTMTANDPDYGYLIGSSNDFYMFKELQEYHNCYDQFESCDVKPVCYNGGYVSVLDGKCQCYCPPELDSSTNCTTKFGTDQSLRSLTWPEATFTILKTSEADCPEGFENGTMVHWPVSNIWSSNPYRHSPKLQTYELGHDVCTKAEPSPGTSVWSPGEYCILRYGGVCPEGFEMGYQDTYGPIKREDANIGTLPDGNHGYPFEYIYCCRKDGSKDAPIKLPTAVPFILYQTNYWGCQQVEGMQSAGEYFDFVSNRSETVNETGVLPYMYRFDKHRRNIHYCFYTPVDKDCGMLKVFEENEAAFIFTSPGYPVTYNNSMECFWHFMSPEGTRMQLDFTDFEVSAPGSSTCTDHVEISFTKPSIKGFKICGHGYRKTTWTWDNFLSLKMVTKLGKTYKGFNATITVYKDKELCYNGDGGDGSYAGKMNYAKSFDPCVPWYKATKCLFNKFDSKVVDWQLTGNSCRNVGVGTQPWCYTNIDTCERQNCDACMLGSCYDIFLDCDDFITKDPDYCTKNELGEAHHGCMKSCGLCEQHVKKLRVKCGTPPVITGITPEPVLSSYDIGTVVTYRHAASGEYRTSTCTSEGSWTEINFVQESCPTGFAVYEQRCFKWLGYNVKVDYDTAVSMCAELGSNLAKIDSPSISSFVQRLVEYEERETTDVWLGAKADDKRVWRWGDGTNLGDGWTNWKSGQPNNWGRNQYCAEQQAKNTWDDITCTHKSNVVCEYQFNKTGLCNDQIGNCMDILMENPEMCTQYPVFATHDCKTTCGVGVCKTDIQCVDDSLPQYQTTRVSGLDNSSPGEYVKYECNNGYIQKSGDAVRICSTSGNLTGTSLICEATDVCSDFLTDCNEILQQNPKMCKENSDFAARYCRSTCGVGDCGTNVTCPDDGTNTSLTIREHGADNLNIGQYVVYGCEAGSLKTSGNYVRVCQSTGSLSGSPLKCSSMVQCEDMITTCEQLLEENPEICELYSRYAWKYCMKTCAFSECKVPTTCTDDTDQGIAAFRLRGSTQIKVGDYLEYTCSEGYMKTGGDKKRACLPNGKLTGTPIVCSSVEDCENDSPDCESMLTENHKLCEEHRQFAWHTCRKTCGYDDSTATCTDDTSGSTMVTRLSGADTLKPGQYVEYMCNDGYLKESGDNVRVCMPSGHLTGTPLTCSRTSTVTSCEDLHTDCEHRLEMNPALCGMFPEYAAHFCRKTCGVSECQPDTKCTATLNGNNNVTKVDGSDQLNAGEFAKYECTADLLKSFGNFHRACLPSGEMTGMEPICSVNHKNSKPSIVCEDQSSLCESDLQETPDMCSKYPDYSWHNCRKTCGVGECRPRTTCTDDTNLGYRATRLAGNDKIYVGEHIVYKCTDGYFTGRGDSVRACLPSGKLTGSPLICLHKDVTQNVDLFTDKEIYKRREHGTADRSVVANVTDMRFTVSGNITSWSYFSNYGSDIAFQIWRFYDIESKALTPLLVGQNIIKDSPKERKTIYRVPEEDQVYVEVGDVIGIYQSSSELSYTRCSKTYEPEHSTWLQSQSKKYKASDFKIGTDHTFVVSSRDCRIYSIRASVNPSACKDGD